MAKKKEKKEIKLKPCEKTVSTNHIWVKQQFTADVALNICAACGLVDDSPVLREN